MKRIIHIGMAIFLLSSISVSGLANPAFTCSDVIEIPQIECEALVALYKSTNGPGWWNSNNWLWSNTISDWYGVTVFSGHVDKLILSNNLDGSLSPELGNLTDLTLLHLLDNHLNGNIPPELGNLTSLKELDLSSNQLSGSIPPELGNLTNLTVLSLDSNQLSASIPPELGNLYSLMVLDLSFNRLSGSIPPELGNFTDIFFLNLSGNQLSGSIPSELGNLTSIDYLNLSGNQLGGSIPPELGKITYLDSLNLSDNQLSGNIPPELGKITYLDSLNLSDNQLSGNIPPELGNISYLGSLTLSGNLLSGSLPPELGKLTNLKVLYLQNNLLTGDVPSTFVNLVNLYYQGPYSGYDGLDLDYNLLNIPPGYPDRKVLLQVFLSQKDPDWQLYQGFEQVIGTGGGELTSLDGKTDILIPTGAVVTDTTFTFMPQPAPHHSSGWLGFAHNSFQLSAQDASLNPVTTFNPPITVTISYTDTEYIGPEVSLGLYYWDGGINVWSDVATTCPAGEYSRDPVANWFSLPLCHMTEFGVFSTPLHVFIPLVRR